MPRLSSAPRRGTKTVRHCLMGIRISCVEEGEMPVKPLQTVVPTQYWHRLDDGRVQCDLCPRFCKLHEGQQGLCFVRARQNDQIGMTSYGRSSGYCIDPIEKKPLYHFLPGTPVLSFGTAGCNLACKFCQNWDMRKAREMDVLADQAPPELIASAAQALGCRSVAYTYNDPIVFMEYAVDVAEACRAHGIKSVAVTAGYITDCAREDFFRHMDAANVVLFGFSVCFFLLFCGGFLQLVLDTLVYLKQHTSVWLEITTLLIPGENDGEAELEEMSAWVAQHLGPDVPWLFSAFHPDWKMRDIAATPLATLIRARDIARKHGMRYVYTGNVHFEAGDSTYCPHCGVKVIGRAWYRHTAWRLTDTGHCLACGTRVAGMFDGPPGIWGARRQPVRLRDFAVKYPPCAARVGTLLLHSQSRGGAAGHGLAARARPQQELSRSGPRTRRAAQSRPRACARREYRAGRAQRLRQIHAAQSHRRHRSPGCGDGRDRRHADKRARRAASHPVSPSPYRFRLSVLQSHPDPHCYGEPAAAAGARWPVQRRGPRARRGAARRGGPRGARGELSGPPLRRRTATPRDRARHRAPACAAASRRADRQPRQRDWPMGDDAAAGVSARARVESPVGHAQRGARRVGGPNGLDEKLYARLRLAGWREIAPRVEGRGTLPAQADTAVTVIGADLLNVASGEGEAQLAEGVSGEALRRLLVEPNTVAVSARLAARWGLRSGGRIALSVGGARREAEIATLFAPRNKAAAVGLEQVVLADIATAQEWLGMAGRLSRIDVALPGNDTEAEARLRAALPPDAALLALDQRREHLLRLSDAFRLNLEAFSLLALAVGMLLIYNAFTFAVVQRRAVIARLRALGATRGELARAILLEAAVLGLAGAAVGVLAGYGFGLGVLRLVAGTVYDLYFAAAVTEVPLPGTAWVQGALLGVLTSVLAAGVPVWEAVSAPVRVVLGRAGLETRVRRGLPWVALAGGVLFGAGLVSLWLLPRSLAGAFAALFTMMLGVALLIPLATLVLMSLLRPLAKRLGGLTGGMAARGRSKLIK